MIPLSRPRRRRWLLMGDQSSGYGTAGNVEPVDLPDELEQEAPDEADSVLDRFRSDCGLTSAFELQIRWPGQPDWQSARVDRPFVMIGRDPLCGVVLDHEDISRRHACVQIVDGVATICDLGSRHGIRKGGRLVQTAELREDESVEMGRISVRVRILHDEPVRAIGRDDDSCAPRIALDFVNHRRRGGGAWSVEKSVTIIGASQPSRVRLEHPSVSRVHCMLVRGSSAWWLVDLGSRIGTMLDGVRVSFAPVAVGAELRIGGFRIRVTAPTDSEIAGDTSGLIEEQPRNGSALLTELTRSSLASRESRSRRTNSGVTEELVVELFREFASLHERTLTQLQQTFRDMLDIAVSPRNTPALPSVRPPAEVRPSMSAQPRHISEPPRHVPEPMEEDSPNLAVVNLSVRAEDPEERAAAHDLLAAQLRSIEDNLEGERKSLARRLLKTLSLGR